MVVLNLDGDTVCGVKISILKYYGYFKYLGHDMARGGENTNKVFFSKSCLFEECL